MGSSGGGGGSEGRKLVMQMHAMDRLVIYDLFDETEEDGDDDGGLDGLAEDDEEDGDGEEVFGHLCLLTLTLTGRRRERLRPEGDGQEHSEQRENGIKRKMGHGIGAVGEDASRKAMCGLLGCKTESNQTEAKRGIGWIGWMVRI